MIKSYFDLVMETFEFPQEPFEVLEGRLHYNGMDLTELVKTHGSPLRITYLPAIGKQIELARTWFREAFKHHNYSGEYHYAYCTKSSHFSFILEEVLKYGAHLELSSSFDVDLIRSLESKGKLNKDLYIICNAFKPKDYVEKIIALRNDGYKNVVPILDNREELKSYQAVNGSLKVGIRVAAQEEPSYEFYTSRLGIRMDKVLDFYIDELMNVGHLELNMIHFFIDSGIKDASFYWIELERSITLYCRLKKICPSLKSLNIGGGLPFQNSLGFEFDHPYIIGEIVDRVKTICSEYQVEEPDIFSEFGRFTVSSSGTQIFSVLGQKQQNDNELWYMLNGSLISSLPDVWGINQRFIMLPLNHWESEHQRVNIGGLSCDIDDYYNAEAHVNQVYLPKFDKKDVLHLAFFNMGAYQEALSGYGGIKHCLLPASKHIILDLKDGKIETRLFREEQSASQMMEVLGY